MPRPDARTVHATCVAVGGGGVLLTGPSGSGKSDLALRLIDGGCAERPAVLVSDDHVLLTADRGRLLAAPPPQIAGRLEVRGVGVIKLPCDTDVEVRLVVELVDRDRVPRLPDRERRDVCGVAIPHLRLAAFDASAPAKIRAALHAHGSGGFAEEIDDG